MTNYNIKRKIIIVSLQNDVVYLKLGNFSFTIVNFHVA